MMKKVFPWILLGAGIVAVASLAWWLFSRGGGKDDPEGKEPAPTAQVRVIPLRRGPIERTLTVYGTAAPAPGGTRSLSFPFECRVVAVQANVGQPVQAGDVLLQIEPSVDARLALDTARGAQATADAALKDVQRRFDAHLATNADLSAAASAAHDARLRFASLQSRTPSADGDVRAPAAGLVTAVSARPGAVIPAGGPLVEIAVANRLEARLGLAPPDAARVRAGQTVRLIPVETETAANTAPLTGTVRVVGQSVDPATRLVDGFVALDAPPPGGGAILVGTYLRAEIVLETKDALLAPRDAVLPEEIHPGRATLFTVKDGKAVQHEVGTGIDDGTRVEILAGEDGGLTDGTRVVTQGAYELEAGMAVETVPSNPAKADAADRADREENSP